MSAKGGKQKRTLRRRERREETREAGKRSEEEWRQEHKRNFIIWEHLITFDLIAIDTHNCLPGVPGQEYGTVAHRLPRCTLCVLSVCFVPPPRLTKHDKNDTNPCFSHCNFHINVHSCIDPSFLCCASCPRQNTISTYTHPTDARVQRLQGVANPHFSTRRQRWSQLPEIDVLIVSVCSPCFFLLVTPYFPHSCKPRAIVYPLVCGGDTFNHEQYNLTWAPWFADPSLEAHNRTSFVSRIAWPLSSSKCFFIVDAPHLSHK